MSISVNTTSTGITDDDNFIERLKKCASDDTDDQLNDLINNPKFIEYFKDKKSAINIDPLMFQKKLEGEEYQNIFKGHMGHSQIFVDAKQDIIKIINSSVVYIFNSLNLLWEEKDYCNVVNMIQTYLYNFILSKIKEISDEKFIINKKADELEKLAKMLKQIQNIDHCEKVFKNAKSKLIEKNFETKLDISSNELPIIKGRLIDLKTKKIRYRQRTDLFTFEIECDYLENSNLEHANRFFNDIMLNSQENVKYLQYILGYSLTCETNLRSLFILFGNGSNGKSVLLEIIQKILGRKLCKTADKRIFIKSNVNSGHTDHLAQLQGTRISIYYETDENEKLNESLIKTLTGSDDISTRKIYGCTFTFKPHSKYFIVTNNKPIFNLSQSMTDRIKYIPFDARFVHEPLKQNEFKVDDIFIEQLKTIYLSEMFTFIVNGAYEYYKNPILKIPEKIQKITDANFNELDTVADFIKNCTEIKTGSNIKKSELFDNYELYCRTEDNQEISVGKKGFYKCLEQKGYIFVKIHGIEYIKNISLLNP